MPVRPNRPWHHEHHLVLAVLALVLLALALVLLLPASAGAQAPAPPPDRTVTSTPATPATWAGPVASGANETFDGGTGGPCSKEPATYCDITLVNADPQSFYGTSSGGVEFSTTGGPGAVDVDLYVYRSDASGAFVTQRGGARGVNRGRKGRIRKRAEGTEAIGALVGSSAGPTADENVAIPGASGWYRVIAVYWDMTNAGYEGRAEFFRRDLFPPDIDDPPGLQDSLASDPGLGYRSHSEPNIAQSPKDPNVLVAASKQYNRDPTSLGDYEFKIGTYVSFDRGRTWTDLGPTATCPISEAPPESWPNNTCYPEDDPSVDEDVAENYITSDPWVDFDDEGNAYLMVLDSPVFEGGAGWGMTFHRWRTPSRGDIRRGRTWSERIPISKYETAEEQATILDDKNTFAVNNAGRDDDDTGPIVACWGKNFPASETDGPQATVCSRSTDGGRTWRGPVRVSPPEQALVIGVHVVPDTRDEDTFYAFWLEYLSGLLDGSGTNTIQMSKTTDGGRTWSAARAIQTFEPLPNIFPRQAFRNLTIPIGAVGPRGEVYLSYADYNALRAGAPDEDDRQADIKLTTSTDGGQTWSAPVRVNQDETNADQFQQYLRVTPRGQLNVSFFDRRLDVPRPGEHPGNYFIDTWLARSNDRGATWAETRLSHDSWDPAINPPISGSGQFIGDYQGLAADNCYAIPFVNDTHLANVPDRDPDFDAGLQRSEFQQVFSWLVPNTARYGGRARDCRGREDDDDDDDRLGAIRTAPSRGARAGTRASRAATRVLRTTPRRQARAVARRNAIVRGP